MPAAFRWNEYNGVATGSPSRGTTGSLGADPSGVTTVNWKSTDNATESTNYQAAPVVAGQCSMPKYQFGYFSGSWNQILNGSFDLTACSSTWPTGVSFNLLCTPTYTTPAFPSSGNTGYNYGTGWTTGPALIANAKNTTAPNASFSTGGGSPLTVYFASTGGPWATGTTTSITNGGSGIAYSCFCVSQLCTTSTSPAGDTPTFTLTLKYDEN